jgi:hypothetical protein
MTAAASHSGFDRICIFCPPVAFSTDKDAQINDHDA